MVTGCRNGRTVLFGLLLLFASLLASGSPVSQVWTRGKVTDATTGEAMPFVHVSIKGTSIGTTTDGDGLFELDVDTTYKVLSLRMMGYEPLEVELGATTGKRVLKIAMMPQNRVLGEVTVSAKRTRRRYSKNNNPAVELAEKVIARRDSNRVDAREQYNRKVYEKLTLALDKFNPDFQTHRFWKHLQFVQKYIDQTPFDATPILTISMRETMMDQSYSRRHNRLRSLVTAYRMEGVDQALGQEGFDESLNEMFTHFDIYDDEIELMLSHFVGPLSPKMATLFYHYYITDTLDVDGVQCVELSFMPGNKESHGFSGHLYVALDGSYRVQRYTMAVRRWVNLNFVRDLNIEQSYERQSDGSYVPGRQDIYCRLYLHKKLQKLYAHRVSVCYDYSFDADAEPLPDSLFGYTINTVSLPDATKVRRRTWNAMRPVELTYKETMLDSLRYEMARLPWFRTVKNVGEVLATGYVPTSGVRDSSRFDIGPVFNFVSHNHEEGWRIRLGGLTTASLDARNFAEGYVAYGFGDRRVKFNAAYVHTFDEKRHHYNEAPHSNIQLLAGYEMETPGQTFGSFTRDNIFVSSNIPRKTQYVGTVAIRLQKQWMSPLSLDTWVAMRNFEPAGRLAYIRLLPDGTTEAVDRFGEAEWRVDVKYSDTRAADSRRQGSGQWTKRSHDFPTIILSHRLGYMEGGFPYQSTDFSLEKRFWFGAFGYLDTKVKAGMVWNRVPYIRLFFPDASTSFWMTEGAFNTMQPMEFVADRYASVFASYHLKGWILNRLPLVKRYHLREVVGFNMIYGGLSGRNNPSGADAAGLFVLPQGTQSLGTTPYMEYSVGIENIFRFIRIDYVRRLTYTDGLAPHDRGVIKFGIGFTF